MFFEHAGERISLRVRIETDLAFSSNSNENVVARYECQRDRTRSTSKQDSIRNPGIISDVPYYGRGIRYRCKYPWGPKSPVAIKYIRWPVFDKLLAWTRIISIASLRWWVYPRPLQQRTTTLPRRTETARSDVQGTRNVVVVEEVNAAPRRVSPFPFTFRSTLDVCCRPCHSHP